MGRDPRPSPFAASPMPPSARVRSKPA